MIRIQAVGILLVSFLATTTAFALTAPEGSTALCKDGTYYSGTSKRGACSHHGGIKDWYGVAATAAVPNAPSAVGAAPAQAPTGPETTMNPQQNTKPTANKMARTTAASGGGAGQVWVNTDSKVYHCPGSRWYGTTKHGEYLSESQAISQGMRADHNKACK